MNKIDGIELLERMRQIQSTKHTPVVVLSNSKEENDLVSAYQLHANSFVRKPVKFRQFMHVLQNIIEYWLVINEVSKFDVDKERRSIIKS
ncbi:MAG TPA: response regulator [Candidatus Latescibacteria bacterium]|nr:response regulator [Candidatus Handelsmanbacteria bacterium]HIL07702.1 response regulator [Candidatus Latescibacterota bacterium]